MELLTQLLNALWAQDFETLANPSMIGMLYFVLFMILFLENGLLPAAFLPGDSLLIPGRRADRQRRDGLSTNHFAAYRRGQPGLLGQLYSGPLAGEYPHRAKLALSSPAHYHQRAHHLFHKHGLSALLIGRFIAFVRTLLPTIAGISGLNNARFQFFNWMSGLLWVLILTSLAICWAKRPSL